MKILAVGNVHGSSGNLERVFKEAQKQQCEKILQVGDFEGYGFAGYGEFRSKLFFDWAGRFANTYGIPLHFIRGNHDNSDWLLGLGKTQIRENIWYHPNSEKWIWGKTSFIAAGGAYSLDRGMRVLGTDLWSSEEISEEDIKRTESVGIVDIVISHDCPITSNLEDYMGMLPMTECLSNRHKLQSIVENVKPKMLIHGHFHYRKDCSANFTDGEAVTWFPAISLGANIDGVENQCLVLEV